MISRSVGISSCTISFFSSGAGVATVTSISPLPVINQSALSSGYAYSIFAIFATAKARPVLRCLPITPIDRPAWTVIWWSFNPLNFRNLSNLSKKSSSILRKYYVFSLLYCDNTIYLQSATEN